MSQPAQNGSCMLSQVDQLMPRMYTPLFLVYKTDQYEKAVKNLNEGLAKTSALLPFLKGYVHKTSDVSNRLSLSWSSQDPPLAVTETSTPESLPSFERLKQNGAPLSVFQESLCPVPSIIDYKTPGAKASVLAIGATRMEGGLILCLCAHHVVMDGAGMGKFLKLWGDCTRGVLNLVDDDALYDPEELSHRDTWLRDASGYFPEAEPQATLEELLSRHPEYSLRSVSAPLPPLSAHVSGQPAACAAKIFAFSSAKLQEVKVAMSKSVPTKYLTVNNVLGAALWIAITSARLGRIRHNGLPTIEGSATSKLGFAINARSKVGPPVSTMSFLGNVTMLKVVELPATEMEGVAENALAKSSATNFSLLTPVITAIAATTSAVTPTHVGEIVAFADRLSDVEDILPGWNSYHGLDLTYTSWADLGMYDCDFGASLGGGPRFVRIPYMPYIDGMVLSLPRRRLAEAFDERIEVAIMMNEQDMQALEENEMIRSWRA
ncbi:uncharacterized protein PV06_06727 [Exophiala oligosperma]|uniref:Condensation domain-containing protein n=1 Tax=Exophiala oligosperma TaxID=215243 RepID=A0A0D2E030_9EURO|nr:uncharacterized protein PV06_06727 [Exophiala oligosperma]KIW41144.1 hypothetical protein PV06_06727 [Exophiala oligosperma]